MKINCWVVCIPEGKPLLATVSNSRQASQGRWVSILIETFDNIGFGWQSEYREGYRCKRATLEVEDK